MRLVCAAALLITGLVILVGWGWACVVAATMILLPALDVRTAGQQLMTWARSRRQLAIGLMVPAALLTPVGVWIIAGVGVAMITSGILLGTVSLLVGWNQG